MEPRVQISGNQRRRLNEGEIFSTVNGVPWEAVFEKVDVNPVIEKVDFGGRRVIWSNDIEASREHSELDYFLLGFPTQLIPQVCFLTSTALKKRNPAAELTQAEFLKYIGILIAMSMEGKFIRNRDYFWMTDSDANSIKVAPDFFGRFGMSLQRFNDISEALRFPGIAEQAYQQDPMAPIRIFIEEINHKRKSVIQPGEYLKVEDCLIAKISDQVKLKVNWIHGSENQHKTSLEGELFGSVNCLCDAETGIALSYDYIDINEDLKRKYIKEFDTITTNQFTSSLLRMSKSFFHSNRTLFTSNVFTSMESASLLAENGLYFVGHCKSLKQKIPIYDMMRWHGETAEQVLVARTTVENKLNGNATDIYALSLRRNDMPTEVEDCPSEFNTSVADEVEYYLFTKGNTEEGVASSKVCNAYSTVVQKSSRPLLVQEMDDAKARDGSDLYSVLGPVPDTFISAKNWWQGPFHALLVRLCMDAFLAYKYELGPSFPVNHEKFLDFVSKLSRQLLGPRFIPIQTTPLPIESTAAVTAALPVSSTSSSSSLASGNGIIANASSSSVLVNGPTSNSNLTAGAMMAAAGSNPMNNDPDLHKYHRLLPLSKLSCYDTFREQNKRAKRRCKICHHPTGYYCLHCSDMERQMYYSMCHPTTKPDSTCYYTHLSTSK